MNRYLIIAFGVGLILCIGTCVYFVAGVSSTFPPIKTYDYKRNIDEFKSDMNKLAVSNKNILYRITDITGDSNTGYKYYFDIFIKEPKRNLQYHAFYDKTDYWFKDNKTEIGLVFAYDQTHSVGGYGVNATGIANLIKVFEKEIIYKLPK
ncbi:hypothetical protein ACFQZS_11095 [Mucilaginibacter calamicampi]|uniref:Lipoprotein n=1 Tax=Mucilaginibacter calamicampi TaxID=1302352 RepID=A0ABW2YWE6_9SPHI